MSKPRPTPRTDGQTVDFFGYLQDQARPHGIELKVNPKTKKFELYDLEGSGSNPIFEHPGLTPVKFFLMGFSACLHVQDPELNTSGFDE